MPLMLVSDEHEGENYREPYFLMLGIVISKLDASKHRCGFFFWSSIMEV